MNDQKIESLLKNEEFMKKILPMQTPEEVQAEFAKKGINIPEGVAVTWSVPKDKLKNIFKKKK